jgi:hypothetical protein
MKTYQTFINEEFLLKNMNFEIFNYPNINKGYIKINKVFLLLFIYLRFLIEDFNFDNTLKNNLKKIFASINEIILNILDNFIFPYINSMLNKPNNNNIISKNTIINIEKFKEYVDKFLIQTKNANRIKKNKKDLFISIVKICDNAINIVKNFSK